MILPGAEKFAADALFATDSAGVAMAIVVDAVLLAVLPSLVAPVLPLTAVEPAAVGVPVTVHVIEPPAAILAGVAGEQVAVKPGGSVPTEHDADVAVTAGAAAFEHV